MHLDQRNLLLSNIGIPSKRFLAYAALQMLVSGYQLAQSTLFKHFQTEHMGLGRIESFFDLPTPTKPDVSRYEENAADLYWPERKLTKTDKLKRLQPIISENIAGISGLKKGSWDIRCAIGDLQPRFRNPELGMRLENFDRQLKKLVQEKLFELHTGKPFVLAVPQPKKTIRMQPESSLFSKEEKTLGIKPLDITSSGKDMAKQNWTGSKHKSFQHFRWKNLKNLGLPVRRTKQGWIELYGDPLLILREKIFKKLYLLWADLEVELLTFEDNELTEYDRINLFYFTKAMFLLAEYIIKFELLPPSFTATMKIFEPTILMRLIKSYISAGNGVAKMVSNYYFNSFMPSIVFLKTSAFMEPFRRAIEEILSSSDQNLLVYHLIKSFIQPSLKRIHYKTLPRDEQSRRIWKGFCTDTFLQDLDALSLISTSNTIDENERTELIQTHKIAPLIQEMITYFDNPPDYCYGYSDKFEIYHILSIIDFLKRNYRSIIDELTPETIVKPDLNKKMECINYLVNHFEHHHNKYSYGENPLVIHFQTESDNDGIDISKWIEIVAEKMQGSMYISFKYIPI
ncbi:hypothetical protein PGT21_027357 [Puccinia graminis f. sp. tritici]|uniref:Uncharacterized protein n=1 Tax=Puccinia graminis f. sp. tritici TaxID=56615 RepID=A0A5B0RYQ9_PUCGR|nr:hypothetical protein PGT21_027357 [Puccinia graminis f. sp. tritici]KAA1131156.1 hypothetical protein PGTUg99_018526 [Puccinia graminis f. sp. tritici]